MTACTWVPAHLFGSKNFGIAIDEIGLEKIRMALWVGDRQGSSGTSGHLASRVLNGPMLCR